MVYYYMTQCIISLTQEIRPYDTKTIAKANFFGKLATNYTSFIRIKTDHPSSPSLVIPVEVEVSESSSLFLSRELLDFGILKSGGEQHYITSLVTDWSVVMSRHLNITVGTMVIPKSRGVS